MDYKTDIRIDPDALDVEVLEHSNLSIKYVEHFAECQHAVERLEEDIKVLRSELILEANEDPEGTLGDGVKPTGPNVEAYYRNHSEMKKLKNEMLDARYEMTVAQGVKDEFSFGRKSMLENLVKLHGQQYFAGPNIPRDLSAEHSKYKNVQAVQKTANKKVKLTRKNK